MLAALMLAAVAPSDGDVASIDASTLLLLLPGAYMKPADFEGVITRLQVGGLQIYACTFIMLIRTAG